MGEESVIVVMDANRTKGSVDALNWALNNVVKPRDNVVVLGILCELGKKSSCFPFHMGVGFSAIWERIEFSVHGDMTPQCLEEEISQKREQYQSTLQPFYRQCKKNKVKLEVKLVAGFDPKEITIVEAHNSNTRWIVLDSHLKRDKAFIHEQAGCNIAAMKGKYVATILSSKGVCTKSKNVEEEDTSTVRLEKSPSEELDFLQEQNSTASHPPSPCWCPPSWKIGFPRMFDYIEVESITDKFAEECIVFKDENLQVYKGCLVESPVLVKCFSGIDDCFWYELKILSKVRHRYISNLVGFCCTNACMFLLQDYSCKGTLDAHLQCDELARKLSWKGNNACNEEITMEGTTVCASVEVVQYLSLDVHAYGLLLLELITGKKAHSVHNCKADPNFLDWVMPLLENGSLSQVMDPRLMDSGDPKEVHQMATAALHCLKSESVNKRFISEVLVVLQERLAWA